MEDLLIKDLATVVGRIPEGHSDMAVVREATPILDKIAAKARDTKVAERLGKTDLPKILTRLLVALPSPTKADEHPLQPFVPYMEMIEKMVAVVAPMTTVPGNIKLLREAGFVHTAMRFFVNSTSKLSAEEWHENLMFFANHISILLNIVLARDTQTNKELASGANLTTLFTLASGARKAGDWAAGADWESAADRAKIAQYLWQLAAILSESTEARLGPNAVAKVYQGFRFFNRAINHPKPACYDSMTREQQNGAFGHELTILALAAQVLKPYCVAQPARLNANILTTEAAIVPYCAFFETLGVPDWVEKSDWAPQTQAGVHQISGEAFNVAASLVLVSISLGNSVPDFLRPRMNGWLRSPVPQLRGVGLGALANSIRSDEASIAALEPPSDLAQALAGLLSASPDPMTQNSVLGLIRNLSVPEVNRARLVPVLDSLLGLRIWAVDSPQDAAQRNAMVTVCNLCSVPGVAAQFLSHADTLRDLTVLVHNSQVPTLRALGLVTFASVIAALGPAEEYPTAWAYTGTEGVLVHLPQCLIRGYEDTTILGKGVKALRSVAEKGTEAAKATLAQVIMKDWEVQRGQVNGAEALARILAPPAAGAPASDPEIEADALAFVRAFKDETTNAAVRLAASTNKAQGRRVVAGAEEV